MNRIMKLISEDVDGAVIVAVVSLVAVLIAIVALGYLK